MFKPKHNLPVLSDYTGQASDRFWSLFPKNLVQPARSLIDAEKFKDAAEAAGFPDKRLLNTVYLDLKVGAEIGCRGHYRSPTRASNAPSALEQGEKVSDAVAAWVASGFAYGPVPLSQVPAHAKFSGLMARDKPNGAVRVILNLSAPKGLSVNEGIDTNEFPTVMSSTTKWLRAMNNAGRRCFFCKVDWSDAYKHVPVDLQDSDLQWFTWLGMAFKELCLIFGGASSAGIYDRLAKIVLFIVIKQAQFNPSMVCQYLDDCCAVSADLSHLQRFDDTYSRVAGHLGVKLAPRDDPTKSFGPATSGVVLGIHYDSVSWTWAVPGEKLIRLLHDLQQAMDADCVRQDLVWRVVGKILHVRPLVPGGRFHILHLLKANSLSTEPSHLLTLSPECRRQLWFWYTMLRTCSGRASLPDLDLALPAWALDIYTDAAGGSPAGDGRGAGAVCPAWWCYVPWGQAINCGRLSCDGKKLDSAMSVLELLAPLLALVTAGEDLAGRDIRFWVDNAAAVFIWKKGYSTSCLLSSTVVSAIAAIAAGLGCRIEFHKITRCSTPLASMADALSKGAFGRFNSLAAGAGLAPAPVKSPVSPSLLRWIADPRPDWELGERLLQELHRRGLGLQLPL